MFLPGVLLITSGLLLSLLIMDLPLSFAFWRKKLAKQERKDLQSELYGGKVIKSGISTHKEFGSWASTLGIGKKGTPGLFTKISRRFSWLLNNNSQRDSRSKVEQLLLSAGVRIHYWEYLLLSAAGVGLGMLVGIYLKNWFISLICGYLGYKVPERGLRYLQERRKSYLSRQLEPALQHIANLYRITRSMDMAIEQAITAMTSPLKDEFSKMLFDVRVAGMTLEEALVRLANRLDLRDFDFFVKIALLAEKYGGDTKDLMLQIPQTIRERQMIRAELETEVAGAKQQAWLLLAGTPLFFIVYKIMRPDFAQILTGTTPGKMGMAVVAVLSLISIFLIGKITEPLS